MGKANPIKMGFGAGSLILGAYIIFNQTSIVDVIGAVFLIGLGIALITWN